MVGYVARQSGSKNNLDPDPIGKKKGQQNSDPYHRRIPHADGGLPSFLHNGLLLLPGCEIERARGKAQVTTVFFFPEVTTMLLGRSNKTQVPSMVHDVHSTQTNI